MQKKGFQSACMQSIFNCVKPSCGVISTIIAGWVSATSIAKILLHYTTDSTNPQTSTNHQPEWKSSAIAQSLTALNLLTLKENLIAEWFFQYLPKSARRNDGRIRTGYLNAYRNPLKGGWGIAGYDPTDWSAEPELRCFKPDFPRIGKDGKPVKYDMPKNAKHNPILPRVDYATASKIFRQAGLNYLQLTEKYAPSEILQGIDESSECKWFWRAVIDIPQIPVTLTEGGKKALSLLSQGRCAIGLTSITTWRKEKGSKLVHPWLALFAPYRRFYISFDQDVKPKTIKAVNRQCVGLGASLIKAGASRVKRLSWSGTAKGIDDFIAKVLKKDGFKAIQNILEKCYVHAQDYRKSNYLATLPGVIKELNAEYLCLKDLPEAQKAKILLVKSEKKTNKTGLLSELILSDRGGAIANLNISYLSKLAIELSARLDIPYRTDTNTTLLRNSLGYSLCIDSFSPDNSVPMRAKDWSDAGISLDEFTQVMNHAAFGTTEIKKFRKKVFNELGQKLADCWKNGKPIRLLDADANGSSVELIYDLIRLYSDEEVSREELESETLTIVNNYRPAKGDLHFFCEPKPKAITAELIKRMKRRENLLILSSSKTSYSYKGTKNIDKMSQHHYKSKKILRIDSETTKDPNHPAFEMTTKKLKRLLKEGVYEIVIASPSICTGISIDELDGYFDAVFSFQAGNLTTNAARQQLVRLRDFQCPRFVWARKTGLDFVGNGSTNPLELLTDEKGAAQASLSLLGIREAEKLIDSNICPLTNYWAKVGAKRNYSMYHYREILLAELEAEGWNIIMEHPDPNDKESKQAWQECKEIQEESVRQEHKSQEDAQDLTDKEAKEMDKSPTQTPAQAAALAKHKIKKKYGVENVTLPLIEADHKKLYPALRLRFWLTTGREFVEERDREVIKKQRERNDDSIFIPDLNRSTSIVKVKALELLYPYLKSVFKPGSEWSNKSPKLKKLKKFVFQDLGRFNQVLKCGIAKDDSPITVVQKILKVIGLKLEYLRNERNGKKRLRIYGAAVSKFGEMHHRENEILEGWFKQEKLADLKRPKPCEKRGRGMSWGGAA